MVKKNKVCISLVVAAATNGVIGRNNQLPWHLPKDLSFFKRVTTGKVVLMGRKTYESIGKPLPERVNIVVTRQPDFQPEGTIVVHSLQKALELAEEMTCGRQGDEMMVIGGSHIFAEVLPLAHRLYLTEVCAEVDGDVYLPPINPADWQERWRENHCADEQNPYDYAFVILDRHCHLDG